MRPKPRWGLWPWRGRRGTKFCTSPSWVGWSGVTASSSPRWRRDPKPRRRASSVAIRWAHRSQTTGNGISGGPIGGTPVFLLMPSPVYVQFCLMIGMKMHTSVDLDKSKLLSFGQCPGMERNCIFTALPPQEWRCHRTFYGDCVCMLWSADGCVLTLCVCRYVCVNLCVCARVFRSWRWMAASSIRSTTARLWRSSGDLHTSPSPSNPISKVRASSPTLSWPSVL